MAKKSATMARRRRPPAAASVPVDAIKHKRHAAQHPHARDWPASPPTTRQRRRRSSTRATRRSTRSSSGRARTSRTASPSKSRPCRSTSRRRSTRRRSSRTCSAARPRRQAASQLDLFADFNGLDDFAKKVEFYHHDQHWTNRLILGDSLLVMTSLAEKERLKGQVQMIYFDPPYGIKFG